MPGQAILSRILVALLTIIPRIGPLKTLAFRPLTPQTAEMFLESVKVSEQHYRERLQKLKVAEFDLPQ